MRLIDADALMPNAELKGVNCIVTAYDIAKAPSIDAVPVIRCKDCKYAYITNDGECKYCDIWFPVEAKYLDGDYYCASAERKEE